MKKLITTAALLVLSAALAVTSFANTTAEAKKSISFDSVIYLTDDAVSPPDVTFTYTLTAGDKGAYTNNGTSGVISKGVLPSDATDSKLTAEADFDADDYVTDAEKIATKPVAFDGITASIFNTSGVYHYELVESYTSVSGLYSNAAEKYHVYVTVVYDETSTGTNSLAIESVSIYPMELTTDNTDDKVSTIAHSYGYNAFVEDPEIDPEEVDNSGIDFIVTDTAFGSWADRTKSFSFSIVTDGIANGTVFKYGATADSADATSYIMVSDNAVYNATASGESFTQGTKFTFNLSDSDTVYIVSVVEGMKFTVTIDHEDTSYTYYARNYYTGADSGSGDTSGDDDNTGATTYEYTVTYTDGDYGSVVFADQVSWVNDGDDTPAFEGTTTRAGYIFAGWSPTVSEKVTGTVIYTATWKLDLNADGTPDEDQPYTITFSAGELANESGVTLPSNISYLAAGDTVKLGTATATGYVFAGWSCDGDTDSVDVSYVVSGNVTLTALWLEDSDGNGTPDNMQTSSTTNGSGLVLTNLGTTTTAATASTSGATFANLGSGTSNGVTMMMVSSTGDASATKTDAYWYELPDESNVSGASTNVWSYTIAAAADKGTVQGIDFGTVSGLYDGSDDDEGITYGEGLPSTGVVLDFAPYAVLLVLVSLVGGAKVYITRKNKWSAAERGE